VAEDTAYEDIIAKVAVENPRTVNTCADYDDNSTRMMKLHEQLGDAYATAAEAAIQEQLAKAGVRLADVLNSLWP
jgi:hypothetical protein